MPHSSGKRVYSRAEKSKIAKEKKSASAVLGGVGSGLKAAALGQLSPAAKKRQEYLRQRAIQDKVTGRGSGSSKPIQPPQQPIRGESATRGIGLGGLIDALSPKQKKKGSRR
jgi:hypothetical protein